MIYKVSDRLKVRTLEGIRELHAGALITLTEDMARPLLARGRVREVKPYLEADGSLVIPFGCDPRYHYWKGGQLVKVTEEEMRQWKQ
jgi:hypothetical protein